MNQEKTLSFQDRLAMFQRRATIGNQNVQNRPQKINYVVNKTNMNERIAKFNAEPKPKPQL